MFQMLYRGPTCSGGVHFTHFSRLNRFSAATVEKKKFGERMFRIWGGAIYVAVFLGACAAPDASTQVRQFSGSVDAASKPMQSAMQAGVAQETKAEKARLISNGELAYDRPEECLRVGFGGVAEEGKLAVHTSDCAISPNFKAPIVRGTSAYAREGMNALKQYAAVIEALQGSKAGNEAAVNFQSFLKSLNAFGTALAGDEGAKSDGLVIRTSDIKPVGALLGSLVEARRTQALRRLVNTAHDEVELVVAELIAHFEGSDGLVDAAEALNDRYQAMTKAQDSGDRATYARTVAAYEKEFARYQKRIKSSHAGRLLAVWKSQQLLHAQINRPGDPATAIKLLEDLKALTG